MGQYHWQHEIYCTQYGPRLTIDYKSAEISIVDTLKSRKAVKNEDVNKKIFVKYTVLILFTVKTAPLICENPVFTPINRYLKLTLSYKIPEKSQSFKILVRLRQVKVVAVFFQIYLIHTLNSVT